MKKQDTSSSSSFSFSRQLFFIMAVGVIALAVITSFTTTWVTNKEVRGLLMEGGLQVTENLAKQSVLALLYETGDNATEAVNTALAFPAVNHVTIFDKDHKPLLKQGKKQIKPVPPNELGWTEDKAHMFLELSGAWHFMAPVYISESADNEVRAFAPTNEPQRELLGHVYVVMDKDNLYEIRVTTFGNNILIAFIIVAILMSLSHIWLKRLTSPLFKLSRIMGQATQGERKIYASLQGSKEIIAIANAFNKMMATIAERDKSLREHNLSLEHVIELRTRELIQARDTALTASRHKSEFLANMSHELRTPLQSIIGYTDLLGEAMECEGIEEYNSDLERIQHNAEHLLGMINNILDLTKIEAGRMELKIQSVNLRQTLNEMEQLISPLIHTNNNELSTSVDGCGDVLDIDGGKLLQILLNLTGNAAKFTQDGKINVHMQHSKDKLEITVSDTGIGMSEEQMSIIFDPFRQVDGSSTRNFQGTGLGLPITQQICKLMGGRIAVKSKSGYGSSFTLTIPLPVQGKDEIEASSDKPLVSTVHNMIN